MICVNAKISIVWFKTKNKSIFFLFNVKFFFFNFLFLCNFDYNVGIEPQFGLREVCNWNNKTDWPRIEFWYYHLIIEQFWPWNYFEIKLPNTQKNGHGYYWHGHNIVGQNFELLFSKVLKNFKKHLRCFQHIKHNVWTLYLPSILSFLNLPKPRFRDKF